MKVIVSQIEVSTVSFFFFFKLFLNYFFFDFDPDINFLEVRFPQALDADISRFNT